MAMDTGMSGVGAKMEPKRMVGLTLFVFALTGGMFLSRVAATVFEKLKWNDPALLGIEDLTITSLVGFALSISVVLYCYFNPTIRAGSLDIAAELKRVTWPSFAETRVSTVAVIIASVVAATILATFDFFSSKVMTVWVPQILAWIARL
jgi:preprotein translocase subunit SecE